MGIQAPPEVKFNLIHEAVSRDNNLLVIDRLCELAGVSRSGYYRWIKAAAVRKAREECDKRDFELILKAYKYRSYAKGAEQIYMRLLHWKTRMNLKKIRRLMRKFGLRCHIRRANPYRKMAQAMKTDQVAPNVIDRNFSDYLPREACLTDITYIPFQGRFCYLSTIKDVCTKEILAHRLSTNLRVEFVLQTVVMLLDKHGGEMTEGTINHSDQGCHYTSTAFRQKLVDNDFFQSMSRKGNCWDNAPQESFFGHMKDEINEKLRRCRTFEQVRELIDDWMDYYNNDRCQWELAKLTSAEYYLYHITGVYPLADV